MDSTYIEFKVVDQKKKTKVYDVLNKKHGDKLGKICWHCNWRQYVFIPSGETIWSADCLKDILIFLMGLKGDKKVLVCKNE